MREAAPLITTEHDRLRRRYAGAIGRPRDALVTPALILDLALVRRNLEFMSERVAAMGTTLRAHVKVHKSPHVARLEVEYGAIGVGCATVWEAIVMARAGIPDVFVINEVVGPEKTRALALLAREAPVKVAVDDLSNVDELSRAAVAAGSTIGVLIDVDDGMRRCGVTSGAEALALARRIADSPGLGFLGLTGGFPSEIVSAAGTATWEVSSAFPGITEIQPGSYATMNAHHYSREPRFAQACTVLSTCISRRPDHLVLDAGNKTLGATGGTIKDHALSVFRIDEEHGIFDAEPGYPIRVGDRVELLCEYTPFAVGYFDAYHVVEGDRVVDIWPVIPRGPEAFWLLDLLERGD